MNDKQAMEIVRECMTDERLLDVKITIKDAWLLVSAIQLATRHPELSMYMKDALFSTARQFQVAIEAVHGEAHELMEMGWDTQFDGVDSLDEVIVIPVNEADSGLFDLIEEDDDDFDDGDDFGDYDPYEDEY